MKKNRSTVSESVKLAAAALLAAALPTTPVQAGDSPVVDTGQSSCYGTAGGAIVCPQPGEPLYGQDAQINGNQAQYQDNGDGTITDLTTGLMWQKEPGEKVDWWTAVANAPLALTGGYTDWRLPTIKELYSLIDFDGFTGMSAATSEPYIDTDFFAFEYGDESNGERFIDAQYCTSTEYVSTTMDGNHTVFGVNFADGRIKGYGTSTPMGDKLFFVKYVRGESSYGQNLFVDNGDGTITDQASGLMWSQDDSGVGMPWEDALAWVQQKNAEAYLGYDDWYLPNVKELQSLVDYSRSPDTDGTPALDPVFHATAIVNAGGQEDYPYYWSGTSHREGPPEIQGTYASYVAFGRALGWMEMPPGSGNHILMDVHGAGSQRSDPKTGDPDDYPFGHGPQGDVIRIFNFVRLVREADDSGTEIFSDGFESGDISAW